MADRREGNGEPEASGLSCLRADGIAIADELSPVRAQASATDTIGPLIGVATLAIATVIWGTLAVLELRIPLTPTFPGRRPLHRP